MTTLLETENYGLYTLKARMITNFIRCSTTGPTWFGYALSSRRTLTTLNAYFKITDIKEAISDTIEDSGRLRYIIMDISPETDLSKIFRPLDNNQASDVMLQKEKARLKRKYGHSSWLRHSQNIAMLMLDRMEELGMSQKQLAEKMNCSPQYISKVLRGRENLSLETLTKIENALEISLIKGEPVAV